MVIEFVAQGMRIGSSVAGKPLSGSTEIIIGMLFLSASGVVAAVATILALHYATIP